MFIPLYPLGVVCEMALMALALPHITATGMYSLRLPNAFNLSFDYGLFVKVRVRGWPGYSGSGRGAHRVLRRRGGGTGAGVCGGGA
jgi:hypothetical protein